MNEVEHLGLGDSVFFCLLHSHFSPSFIVAAFFHFQRFGR